MMTKQQRTDRISTCRLEWGKKERKESDKKEVILILKRKFLAFLQVSTLPLGSMKRTYPAPVKMSQNRISS